jgi:predicted O-methyltransferase YrrM
MSSRPNTATLIRNAADEFDLLAHRFELEGAALAAEKARRCAAELDLSDAELQKSWGGPFNGQAVRREMFEQITKAITFDALVETGTYRGTTTSWIAEHFSAPILTCEINPRYHLQSKMKLSRFSQVRVDLCDSVRSLSKLPQEYSQDKSIFFYLDAHWADHLPLVQELGIIQHCFPHSVVMIDDFEVPLDSGYGYDDYGPGQRIDLNLLLPFRDRAVFFLPSGRSDDETGAKRGVCVLAWQPEKVDALSAIATLRAANNEDWEGAKKACDLEKPIRYGRAAANLTVDEITGVLNAMVETYAIRLASAISHAFLSPILPGDDPMQDQKWGPFLTEVMKSIVPLRRSVAPDEMTQLLNATVETYAIRLASAIGHAFLSPVLPGDDPIEDEKWGPFLTEFMKPIVPLRRSITELQNRSILLESEWRTAQEKLRESERVFRQVIGELDAEMQALTSSRWVQLGVKLGLT